MDTVNIILAEDERIIRTAVASLLTRAGYCVRTAADGEKALELYRERRPDLMILDVMMPRMDGFAVCEEIRAIDAQTPVVFLTQLEGEKPELRALEAGGDNYIAKTVSDELLLARTAAALRTRGRVRTDEFDFSGWRVNTRTLSMSTARGDTACLSKREASLLEWFAAHPGEVFSRDFLLLKFWDEGYRAGDSSLSVAIMRLREKLSPAGSCIMSVRSRGYAYRPR